jgi:hypothetical protein
VGRVKRPAKHDEKSCPICKHPKRAEIERDYGKWFTYQQIAYDHEVGIDGMSRHFIETCLDIQRVENTDKVVNFLIERGMEQNPSIDGRTLAGLIKLKCEMQGKIGASKDGDVTNILILSNEQRKERLVAGLRMFGLGLQDTPQLEESKEVIDIEVEEVVEN